MADVLGHLDAALPAYRIERQLGHGGMATVSLAQDRKVAITVLRPDHLSWVEELRRRVPRR